MGKKILSPTLYPINRSLTAKWFVQYWTDTTPSRRVKQRVPDLPDLIARLNAANDIITSLKKNPAPSEKLATIIYTEKLKLAWNLFESRKGSLKKKTYDSYKSHFLNFNSYLHKNNIRTLSPSVAVAFLESLVNFGYHPKTINSYRTTFNTHFEKLKKKKIIRENPFAETEILRGESQCPDYFKTHEVVQLKGYMLEKKPFLWAAIRWIFYQFIRPNELRNLKVGDIDFDEWRIKIQSSYAKNSKSVWLPIMDGLKKEIQPLCLYQYPPNYYLVGLDGLPSETQVGSNYWNYHHRLMLKELKYNTENKYGYGWKHTGFWLAYKNGVGIMELKLLARHHSIEQTYMYMRRIGLIDFPDVRSKFPTI